VENTGHRHLYLVINIYALKPHLYPITSMPFRAHIKIKPHRSVATFTDFFNIFVRYSIQVNILKIETLCTPLRNAL